MLSFNFFILLCTASYTASLATSLIIKEKTSVGYASFQDAVDRQAKVCVMGGTAMEDYLNQYYPTATRVASASPFVDHAAGRCDVVVSTKEPEFDFAVVAGAATNPGCALTPIGGADFVIKTFGGGWMIGVDYSGKCTSLLNDVFAYWLLELDIDGTIASIYADLTAAKTTSPCRAAGAEGGGAATEGTALTIEAMAGIFSLHSTVCCLVILAYLAHWFVHRGEPVEEDVEDERPANKSDLERLRSDLVTLRDELSLVRSSFRAAVDDQNGHHATESAGATALGADQTHDPMDKLLGFPHREAGSVKEHPEPKAGVPGQAMEGGGGPPDDEWF